MEILIYLTHFIPLVSFYKPWKHQKTLGFQGVKTRGIKHVNTFVLKPKIVKLEHPENKIFGFLTFSREKERGPVVWKRLSH